MLTRSQVARRLGKSIATVRQLEDRALYPVRGEHNVRLFDDWEVDRLKRDPEKLARFAQSSWFKRNRTSERQRASKTAPPPGPARTDLEASRAHVVAAELETVCELLLDVPAAQLRRAGLDEAAFEVLATAIEVLRERD